MIHRILNLGAGTQSSVVALMCERGDLPPVQAACFADTQAEPKEVYEHLNWLAGVPYEEISPHKWRAIPGTYSGGTIPSLRVVVVTAGNLESDAVEFRRHRYNENSSTGSKGYASIPLFVLNPDGSQGIIRRQCTSEYKIEPITRYIRREVLGVEDGRVYRGDDKVEQVFGISFDERTRARSGEGDPRWMLRSYPLVDMKLTRNAVIALGKRWFPDHEFPRSACRFCPYKSNAEWRRMKETQPEEWAQAVQFDREIRVANLAGIEAKKILVGTPFVHRQLVPLDEVDLRTADERDGQFTFHEMLGEVMSTDLRKTADGSLAEECEGMCGV